MKATKNKQCFLKNRTILSMFLFLSMLLHAEERDVPRAHSNGNNRMTVEGDQARPTAPDRKVRVCHITNLKSGEVRATLGNACRLKGSDNGTSISMGSEFIDAIKSPFVLSNPDSLCTVHSTAPTENAAKEAFNRELSKRVMQYCREIICKVNRLGDSCNLSQDAVEFDWSSNETKVLGMLGDLSSFPAIECVEQRVH